MVKIMYSISLNWQLQILLVIKNAIKDKNDATLSESKSVKVIIIALKKNKTKIATIMPKIKIAIDLKTGIPYLPIANPNNIHVIAIKNI